jgi:hypothetical protein
MMMVVTMAMCMPVLVRWMIAMLTMGMVVVFMRVIMFVRRVIAMFTMVVLVVCVV